MLKQVSAVSRPYTYYFGVGRDNMDYETVLLLLISVICALFCSTMFSADTQTIETWLQCLLPSGGIGTGNAVSYMITDCDFLHLGAASFRNADVIMIVTAVEIPLFLLLTLAFCRRKNT